MTEPISTKVATITDAASSTAVAANPDRSNLVLTNVEVNTMWLACSVDGTTAAVVNEGLPLYPGEPLSFEDLSSEIGDEWATGQINAIAAAGGAAQTIAIFESYKS